MAVQGKLNLPVASKRLKRRTGVVDDVAVVEQRGGPRGSSVALRGPQAETAPNSAQRNRDRLENQVMINRVVLGEQPESSLSANQKALLKSQRQDNVGRIAGKRCHPPQQGAHRWLAPIAEHRRNGRRPLPDPAARGRAANCAVAALAQSDRFPHQPQCRRRGTDSAAVTTDVPTKAAVKFACAD